MPNRWPIADGNWSDSAIWSGSIIPTASDDVFANNRTVNIDTNIQVLSLRNSATGSAVTGGQFKLLNNVVVTSSIQALTTANSSTTFNSFIEISQSNSATIVGNITLIGGTGNYRYAVKTLDSSNLVISGNLTTGGASSWQIPLLHWSSGTVRISGSVTAGTATNDYGIWVNTSGSLFINGNVNGGTSTNTYGINSVGANSFININGNVSGSSGTNATGIINSVFNTIIVTGSVAGGFGSACYGITNSGNGFIFITGSVISRGNNSGLQTSAASVTVRVIGPISASFVASPTQFNNGLVSTGATATNLFTGPFFNTGSYNAIWVQRMQMIEPTSTSWRFDTDTGGSKTLYTSNQLPGVPRQTDVRKGIQYNFGLTGSLEMPDPSVVQTGVAVDNTTGSAVLTAQDMFNVLTQDIIETGSIGETLKNASSVQTVGATISSFKV